MDTNPNPEPPKILGTAKLLASQLITKYGKRESDGIAKILTEFITGMSNMALLLDPEAVFSEAQYAQWQSAAKRLLASEPIQYVTGKAWFRDLEITIRPGALIPRPESEELVDWVIEELNSIKSPSILDIGTGSGCLALSLSSELSTANVSAIDISDEALAIAKENANALQLSVQFEKLDVLRASNEQYANLDAIICNPPYIPNSESSEMETHVTGHEPALALFVDDASPVVFYYKVSELGLGWLKKDAWLFFEIHENYGAEVVRLMEADGYLDVSLRTDLSGRDRMVAGKRPS